MEHVLKVVELAATLGFCIYVIHGFKDIRRQLKGLWEVVPGGKTTVTETVSTESAPVVHQPSPSATSIEEKIAELVKAGGLAASKPKTDARQLLPTVQRGNPVTNVGSFFYGHRVNGREMLHHAQYYLEGVNLMAKRLRASIELNQFLSEHKLLDSSKKEISASQCSTIERLVMDGIVMHRGKGTDNHRFILRMELPPVLQPPSQVQTTCTYVLERVWQVVD